jgi:stage II sporulation protein D
MKNKPFIIALIFGVLLPCMLLLILSRMHINPDVHSTRPKDGATKLRVLMTDGTVAEILLEEYILGVVLGEMPASFELEALKAQAVVARTYTVRANHHENADICTDHTCCQAYCAPKDYTGSASALQKVRKAVEDTAGEIVTYQGKPIEATYFSCSGGRTEDAVAVWGQDVPYLQAVDSPGEEKAANYLKTTSMTAGEFAYAFGGLSGPPSNWIGDITYTKGGGVDTIQIGGTVYKGTQVRQLLGLRSTAFVITVVGSSVTITTKGSGHRVGMSQYGADAMALSGSDYKVILAHYYLGTALQGIDNAG